LLGLEEQEHYMNIDQEYILVTEVQLQEKPHIYGLFKKNELGLLFSNNIKFI
jgi:hypothetical protein